MSAWTQALEAAVNDGLPEKTVRGYATLQLPPSNAVLVVYKPPTQPHAISGIFPRSYPFALTLRVMGIEE